MNLFKNVQCFASNSCRLVQNWQLLGRSCQKRFLCVTTIKMSTNSTSSPKSSDVTFNTRQNENDVDPSKYRIPLYSWSMEQMGYKLTLNDDETVATVRMPGLSMESFDRNGNPSITSLMNLVVFARYFAYHKPLGEMGHTFCDYAKLTDECLAFMASVEIEIDKAMYDPTLSKSPTDFQFQLGYIGKASFNSYGKLIIPSTGQVILRNTNQLVLISKANRRPVPLPDWWKAKYAGLTDRNEPLIVQRMVRPTETFVTRVKVRWTDTDSYDHANWASYVRYCINATHEAIRKKFFKNITKECVQEGLRKIRMGFTGENLEGDVLTIHTWESLEDHMTVCCEVENNGDPVFHTTLCYLGKSLL